MTNFCKCVIRTYNSPVKLQLGPFKWKQLGKWECFETDDEEIINAARRTPMVGCDIVGLEDYLKDLGPNDAYKKLMDTNRGVIHVWANDLGCDLKELHSQNPCKEGITESIMVKIFGMEDYNNAKINSLREKLGTTDQSKRRGRPLGSVNSRDVAMAKPN